MNRVSEAVDGACCRLAQDRLELGGSVLDRVEVGRVGRQVTQDRSCGFDDTTHFAILVSRQVVYDNRVVGAHGGRQNLLDIGLERCAVHRPIKDPECGDDA